jgi:hypothetical protein
MVAFPPLRSAPRNRRKLIAILLKVGDDLATLAGEAQGLLAKTARKSDLSPQALTALARLARNGRRRLRERLAALGADKLEAGAALAALPGEVTVNALIQVYRRCGRRLCLAQCEAREAADGQTADLVFHLLRDLERQLWLLDAGRGGVPFETMAAPAVFQFC